MGCLLLQASETKDSDYPLVPTLTELYQPHTFADTRLSLSKEQRAKIKKWRAQFIKEHGNRRPHDVLAEERRPEKFSVFYMAHPGPAHALWHFAKHCYEIERVLSTHYAYNSFINWRDWADADIFVYLTHEKRTAQWRGAFRRFASGEGTVLGGLAVDGRALMAYLDLVAVAGIESGSKDQASTGICFYAELFSTVAASIPAVCAVLPDALVGCVKDRAAIVKNGLQVLGTELLLAGRLAASKSRRFRSSLLSIFLSLFLM